MYASQVRDGVTYWALAVTAADSERMDALKLARISLRVAPFERLSEIRGTCGTPSPSKRPCERVA